MSNSNRYKVEWSDEFPPCYYDTIDKAMESVKKVWEEQNVRGRIFDTNHAEYKEVFW